MSTVLEVLNGPDRGKIFHIRSGLRLGRTQGEVLIRDSKASGLHAIIEVDPKGHFILVDQQSSNGIKVSENLVKRVTLMPGVIFVIGRTGFRVAASEAKILPQDIKPQIALPMALPSPLPQIRNDDQKQSSHWTESLQFWIKYLKLNDSPPVAAIEPFKKLVHLAFIEGIQTNQEIHLGFGPRRAGSDVLDIELFEESAPPIAFELHPHVDGILFKTAHPILVHLNERPVQSESLKSGDMIRIGKTLIKVTLMQIETYLDHTKDNSQQDTYEK